MVPWEQAQIHVLSHTLHYGTGVFARHRVSYETARNGRSPFFGSTRSILEFVRRIITAARILRACRCRIRFLKSFRLCKACRGRHWAEQLLSAAAIAYFGYETVDGFVDLANE